MTESKPAVDVSALRALVVQWRMDAAYNPRDTSPGYSCGLEKCAMALEAVIGKESTQP